MTDASSAGMGDSPGAALGAAMLSSGTAAGLAVEGSMLVASMTASVSIAGTSSRVAPDPEVPAAHALSSMVVKVSARSVVTSVVLVAAVSGGPATSTEEIATASRSGSTEGKDEMVGASCCWLTWLLVVLSWTTAE